MGDLQNLERRLDEIERKLDDSQHGHAPRPSGECTPARRWRGGTARVLFGVLILLLGLLYLGKDYVYWLQHVKFWPIAVIAFGLIILFGERGR